MQEFILSYYNWIKSLHLIAVIAWMAGMMYLPRLFIYHHQAQQGGEADKYFKVMERRLLKGIMNPSLIAVWVLGLLMLVAIPGYASSGWFITKFIAVIGISGIHGFYSATQKKFEYGDKPKTEKFWRIINEVPFILLIIIVIMVIVKPF
ncbi:MAG: protoporphyrinogen oxidase HemJ [Aquisalinus sp.]|nr:protoporphyrinogen oxidase HemJ [Aquisalinus sp.]